MLYRDSKLDELYVMKHRNDSDYSDFVDYENNIFYKTLSDHIFKNDMMFGFLSKLQPLMASFFDRMNLVKNFRNIMVDKYYHKHKN
jgi:hypothetical protein